MRYELEVAFNGDRLENKIALTFDDGPNPYFTGKILDILKTFDVKASFFLIGRWVGQNSGIVKRMVREGHVVGGHTYTHGGDNGEGLCFDFNAGIEAIENVTKEKVKYIRFPGFGYNEIDNGISKSKEIFGDRKLFKKIKKKEIFIVDHDNSWGSDYEAFSAKQIISQVILSARNGLIQDLHDGSSREFELEKRPKYTFEALPIIINFLKKKYDLVNLDEMRLQSKKQVFCLDKKSVVDDFFSK